MTLPGLSEKKEGSDVKIFIDIAGKICYNAEAAFPLV